MLKKSKSIEHFMVMIVNCGANYKKQWHKSTIFVAEKFQNLIFSPFFLLLEKLIFPLDINFSSARYNSVQGEISVGLGQSVRTHLANSILNLSLEPF